MLGDKPVKKTSPTRFGVLVGGGVLLSLPAIFISISGPAGIPSDLTLGDALWNVRGLDVVLQAIVVFTIALGIGIVLYQKNRKGRA